MSTQVTYKGNTIANFINDTKTLKTAGKYMEDDVTITEVIAGQGNVWQDEDGYVHLDDESGLDFQAKSVNPTESSQTVRPDSGYTALSQVTVGAISSSYVGSGISRKSSTDLTVSGATVTAPAGYYSSSATKTVASGTAGTPTATKGNVSNNSISVTPSVTNTTGYITGSTKTGTAVTVSASELVSGTYSVTSSGTKDVTNYASASVPALTLPTAASTTSSGTNKATISRSTSNQYINIPTGFNNTAQYYTVSAVANGTAGNPTATKGTVSNNSISVTPTVTNTTGYITGGTKTGTAVTISASELVSGTKSITENGTGIDVINYASVNVNVPSTGGNDFVVTFSQNQSGDWEPDCTFAEVLSAYNNGKNIVAMADNGSPSSMWYTYEDEALFYYIVCEYYDDDSGYNWGIYQKTYIWTSSGIVDDSDGYPYYATSLATAVPSDVANGKRFYNAQGMQVGTASGGGGGNFTVDDIAGRAILGAISGNATFIFAYAFYNCTSLTQASFPSCSSIGTSAFYNCTSLSQVSFPSCTTIGAYAFYKCVSLAQASFPSCYSIGMYAFYSCSLLSQVSFPLCSAIRSSAFYDCASLTQVSFPSCTTIRPSAFARCTLLDTVIFNHTSTVSGIIYSGAFYSCYRLLSLYLLASTLYSLSSAFSSTFYNTPMYNSTAQTGGVYGGIFVPSSLYNTYITAANWSNASSRFVSLTATQVNNVLLYGRHDP